MADYVYTKTPVAVDRLANEIAISAIVTALNNCSTLGAQLTVVMRDTLSAGDETILNEIVSAHAGVPLTIVQPTQPVSVTSQPDPVPFAQPTYRTKRDTSGGITTVAKNTTGYTEFQLGAERYVSGGDVIIENAEFGDYLIAKVTDVAEIIPAPYRAALCEAWPIVATYIVKAYVPVRTPGSIQAGSMTTYSIDTYPLNAKITAGLFLEVEYHAVDVGLSRRFVVNYNLTRKL